ncbi:nose resistant to fluoxetine protein 6 [Nephila pilipes]|uniref:Nose resistant to fluoxetine protein 6 n=1 Tax=Nephila pilipes TaxID=299642 RepID=A0A8X6MUP9_NEPPI|nr:nose resistant to fluoxetine protein 6 [Nephila pilipes]
MFNIVSWDVRSSLVKDSWKAFHILTYQEESVASKLAQPLSSISFVKEISVITFLMGMLHNLHVTSAKIGVCTPSLCTAEDVRKLVQIIPEKLALDWKVEVSHCETQEPLQLTQSQLIVMCVMGVIILAVIIGSLVDIMSATEQMEENSLKALLLQMVKAFSFPANARKLSEYTCPHEPLAHVYGLMFIVFYWVAISNTFMYVNYDVTSNFMEAFKVAQAIFYEIVLNRVIPLQVLFYISGLMTTYKWLKNPEQTLNVGKFLFKRYIRFTPAYAFILALMIITPTWGSGPSWYTHLNPIYNNCKDHWWYNLLYINNYIDSDKVCLDHTWVIAVDAQLHIMAVFILIPLKIRPKLGLLVNLVLAVASLVSVALTNVYYDLPPNEALAFLHVKDRHYYAEHSYYRMYSHIGLYCTGVFVAYLVHMYPTMKISKKTSGILWGITLLGFWGSTCSVHAWRNGIMPSSLIAAVYVTLSKVALGALLAWISVSCITGQATGLKDVLSWRPFAFLARLFFIAYIMHVPIINMVMSYKREHFFITDLELFYVVLNHVSGTLIVSYILFVYLEAPFLSLADVIRKRYKTKNLTEKPIKFPEKSPAWKDTCEKSHC